MSQIERVNFEARQLDGRHKTFEEILLGTFFINTPVSLLIETARSRFSDLHPSINYLATVAQILNGAFVYYQVGKFLLRDILASEIDPHIKA